MEPTIDQILDRAADIVDIQGWCRHDLQTFDGRVCVEGAIRLTCGVPNIRVIDIRNTSLAYAKSRADNAYAMLTKYLSMQAYRWNDTQCRDRYEAADALRQAAKTYRETS